MSRQVKWLRGFHDGVMDAKFMRVSVLHEKVEGDNEDYAEGYEDGFETMITEIEPDYNPFYDGDF